MISYFDIQRGYEAWAAKPHNAKWVRKIDGTPIANDIVVCIWEAIREDVINAALSTPPAEPVAWAEPAFIEMFSCYDTAIVYPTKRDDNLIPLYTHPPALSTAPSPVGSRDGLIERLVKALSAFAEAADIFEREYGDKMKPDTGCNIKFSALCEARAVLASKEQQS